MINVNVAIVGAGRGSAIGRVFASRDDCRVAAVCDVDLPRAQRVAQQLSAPVATADFSQLLDRDDIDAVVIATPPPFHASQSVQALEAGKHVLSEVPAVWTMDDAKMLVAAVQHSPAVYMMAENMAYFAWVQTFEQLVRDGFIGEPVYAECEYVHDLREGMMAAHPAAAYDQRGRTWRGAMGPVQYCTHDLGPVLRMFDDRVVSVVGMNTGPWIMRRQGVIDAEVMLCKTARGKVIKFLASFVNARRECRHYFSIYGTEGVLESPRIDGQPFVMRTERIANTADWIHLPLSISHPHLAGHIPSGGHGTSEWLMVEDFVQACRGDRPPAVDVYTALDWSLPGLLGHISAMEGGRPMPVPDPRQWPVSDSSHRTEEGDR